ncbi:hypothetical protein, partial [Saccharopolyspora sp. NPDC002686]|uniref:hypothetical protein n=1 Tax=Saccharopolyspora sp. NPDC002686 TaxID=3154541 RepID=UPI00332109A3
VIANDDPVRAEHAEDAVRRTEAKCRTNHPGLASTRCTRAGARRARSSTSCATPAWSRTWSPPRSRSAGGKSSISGYVAREPIFRRAYGNVVDATLHSTTYFGFGEETATALEAVSIAVEDDYPSLARKLGERLEAGLRGIADKYPKLIRRTAGVGALHGVFLHTGGTLVDSALKLVPSKFAQDPQARSKILTAAVIAALYRDHDILTFYGSNREIALIVSPPLVATEAEVEPFLTALDEVLSRGAVNLISGLVREKASV